MTQLTCTHVKGVKGLSIMDVASTANTTNKVESRESRVLLTWSIRTFVAQCHISLSVVPSTSLASLTIWLGKCGHIWPEPKIGCSWSSRNYSPWWRTSLTTSWNACGPTMGKSSRVKNSSDFVGIATSHNLEHNGIVERMNQKIQEKMSLCSNTPYCRMVSG